MMSDKNGQKYVPNLQINSYVRIYTLDLLTCHAINSTYFKYFMIYSRIYILYPILTISVAIATMIFVKQNK